MSEHVHLPSPSLAPFILGAGVTLMAFGIVASLLFTLLGLVLTIVGLASWIRELIHE